MPQALAISETVLLLLTAAWGAGVGGIPCTRLAQWWPNGDVARKAPQTV